MDAGLSPYIRKKMMRPFVLGDFKRPDDFVKLLEKHGIKGVKEKELENFEREGWLQPAFRLVLPEQDRRGNLLGVPDIIQQYYKEGCIELPQAGDFEP